jgi:hypothetical protein
VGTRLRTSIPSDTSQSLATGAQKGSDLRTADASRRRFARLRAVGCKSRGGSSPLRRTGEPRELQGFRCPGWTCDRLRGTDATDIDREHGAQDIPPLRPTRRSARMRVDPTRRSTSSAGARRATTAPGASTRPRRPTFRAWPRRLAAPNRDAGRHRRGRAPRGPGARRPWRARSPAGRAGRRRAAGLRRLRLRTRQGTR